MSYRSRLCEVGWGGSYRDGVGHTGAGWVCHALKQSKNDSPLNQDFTPTKSFWKRYKI